MLIIDDFLPKVKFDELSKFVMSTQFPWYYASHVSLPPWEEYDIQDPLAKETDGWYHMLYSSEDNYDGYYMNIFQDFFEELTQRFGYTKNDLIRARLGLKQPKFDHKDENYNLPHVDYNDPHDTIIYYLNDSDGDTRMFKEHARENPDSATFNVDQRIEPKANRLVIFDGLQYHTASNPIKTNRRVILNINLKCK
jgi:hypothetical protein